MLSFGSNTTLLQRLAGRTLVALCLIQGAGLIVVAVARAGQTESPHVRFVDDPGTVPSTKRGKSAPVKRPEIQSPSGPLTPATGGAEEVTPPLPSPAAPMAAARHQQQVMWMEVTAYCPCTRCCGPAASGLTASGKPVSYNNGAFVAADTRVLPFGTRLHIPGYHSARPVQVIDRGGAIKGARLDVFFPHHQQARQWGRRWVQVTIAN